MKLAITGGTGFVGKALIAQALAAGHTVQALARRPQDERPGVTWVAGDLGSGAALDRLVKGADAVIHVAGAINAPDAAGFDAANVAGTDAMLRAAENAGVTQFVFVSSLSAREPGLSDYGASKAKAEAVVRRSPLSWTMVRPPAVYGPHDREMFELFRAAKWGVVPVPAHGRASVIHVDDLAQLLLALADGAAAGRVVEPDDGARDRDGRPGWDNGDLARAIGTAMGRRVRVLRVARRWMERASRIDRLIRGRQAKLTADRVGYLTHPDWVVAPHAAVPDDVWMPKVTTRDGLVATARWYREAGWL